MNNPYHKSGDFDEGKIEWNEYPEFQAWEEGKQAGIKEVVEWIRESGIWRDKVWVDDSLYKEWQSKLKEWGINAL